MHLVFYSVNNACVSFEVDGGDDVAVFHVPVRMLGEHGSFYLELYYGDGFVHHRNEASLLFVNLFAPVQDDTTR